MEFITAFKAYYGQFDQKSIDDIDFFYHKDVIFSDPIHRVEGRDSLKQYFAQMCGNLISCRFEFVGETIDANSAWFKWVMHYQHPKLKGGKSLSLTGASYLVFGMDEDRIRIISHEDFYDMGSMLYEHTPILGTGVRWLKQQLGKTA